ncbi:hypothetical protein DPMN_027822 [Dreissena polymorpha]|uniref:Uncharacterized protein n=1 Tax=Dreissena polymorpha TaxID=45954 RepID=A0A9D4RDT2_DREPO|nr:hypothetical protein DPMN_027822 [Dreissena polymorpha]
MYSRKKTRNTRAKQLLQEIETKTTDILEAGYTRGRNNRGRGRGSVQSEKEQKSEDTKPVDDSN